MISYMDYLLYDDIVKATYAEPLLPPKHQFELGFPDLYEARFSMLKTALSLDTYRDILTQARELMDRALLAIRELSASAEVDEPETSEPEPTPGQDKKNAFEWQYALTDARIQEKVKSNNLKHSQNFFINFQSYPRTIIVPANETITLKDFLVFQPQQVRLDLDKFLG